MSLVCACIELDLILGLCMSLFLLDNILNNLACMITTNELAGFGGFSRMRKGDMDIFLFCELWEERDSMFTYRDGRGKKIFLYDYEMIIPLFLQAAP